jgi:FixJ family two-component response regulator
MVMPDVSGRELSGRLLSLHPEMCLLYMSGYTEDAIVQGDVLEEGAPFIQKPFSADELVLKVRAVLDARLQQET